MTDAYKIIRENLFKLVYGDETVSIMDLEIPSELMDMLYECLDLDNSMKIRYCNSYFTEEDWDKIKAVCELWDSPLMRALR